MTVAGSCSAASLGGVAGSCYNVRMANEELIRVEHVNRMYRVGERMVKALDDVSLSIAAGEFVVVVGPSGSGKTTLLNVMAGIDRPNAGQVRMDGVVINALDENQLALWRGAAVGIVFQFFQLLPTLTALENVMLPMELRGSYRGERRERTLANLTQVGLAERVDQLPSELSGGEQQRVAIARALANDPAIVLADEPTGNLDTITGLQIVDLLARLSARGKTVVLVTHDETLATRATRRVHMRDGRSVAQTSPQTCLV